MKQKNYNNQKENLTEQDIESIVALVCYKCRAETYNKVRSRLTYFPLSVPEYGILDRLIKEDSGGWSYIAGQNYPEEIVRIKNIFLKDYKK